MGDRPGDTTLITARFEALIYEILLLSKSAV